jgi:hypothetical protein
MCHEETLRRRSRGQHLRGLAVVIAMPQREALREISLSDLRDKIEGERINVDDLRWSWKGNWESAPPERRRREGNTRTGSAKGAEAAIQFHGTGAILVGPYMPTGGRADIYLDGKLDQTVDVYPDEDARKGGESVWHAFGLPAGDHNLRVVVRGERFGDSKGSEITLTDLVVFRQTEGAAGIGRTPGGTFETMRLGRSGTKLEPIQGQRLPAWEQVRDRRALSRCRQTPGATPILDPAPANANCLSMLPHVDFLTPNETEAMQLLGLDGAIDGDDQARQVARKLRDRGVSTVVIRLGSQGFCVVNDEISTVVSSYEVSAVDTTAAGTRSTGRSPARWCKRNPSSMPRVLPTPPGALSFTRPGAQTPSPLEKKSSSSWSAWLLPVSVDKPNHEVRRCS